MKTGILITLLTVVVLWAESITMTQNKNCTLFVDPSSQLYEPRIIEIPFTMDWGTLDDTENRRCTVITNDPALNINYSEYYKRGTLYYVSDYSEQAKEIYLKMEARSWNEPDTGDTVDLIAVPCSLSVSVVSKNDLKPSQFEWLNTSEGLLSNNIKNVVVIDSNNIWIHYGTLGSLTHIKNGEMIHWNKSTGLPDNGVWKIIPFKEGVIALCCDGDVLASPKTFAYLDGEQCHTFEHKACDNLLFPTITISPDNNSAWMSYQERAGIARFDGEQWHYFDSANGLSESGIVKFAFPAKDSTIWVTYYGARKGWDFFDGTQWKPITNLDTMSVDSIALCATDGAEGIYIQRFSDELYGQYGYFANDTLTMYTGTEITRSLSYQRSTPNTGGNGSIWMIREMWDKKDILFHFNKREFKKYSGNNGLLPHEFHVLYMNATGQGWLNYYRSGDISFYNGEEWTSFDEELFPHRADKVYPSGGNCAWFSYWSVLDSAVGVSYYDGESFMHSTKSDGFPPSGIRSLYPLGNGTALVTLSRDVGAIKISKDFTSPVITSPQTKVSTFSIAPMKGKFLLTNAPRKEISLKVFNVKGQLLQSQKLLVNTSREVLSLPKSLSAGCYIVSVEAGMQKLSQRFVVQ